MKEFNKHLYHRIKDGDKDAFKLLFENYYTSLFFYACKFVDDELARDAVHDTFYYFWKKRDSLEITSSLNAYLFTMVRNRCLQQLEKQKVRDNYSKQVEVNLKIDEISYYNNGFQSLIEKELAEQLNNAILKMPKGCQTIFKMSRYDGLKNLEIAEQQGISIKAVEKQMTKALKILRVELKDYLPLISFIYFGGSDFM